MYQLNRDDLSLSAEVFLAQTGHNIIELLNKVLTNKDDLTKLVEQNNVEVISDDLPGLIVQAYLVLVRLFELNVMQPINNAKIEAELTPPASCDYFNYEDSDVTTDDDFKVEMLDSDDFVPENEEPPAKRQKYGTYRRYVQKVSNIKVPRSPFRDPDGHLDYSNNVLVRFIGEFFTEGQVKLVHNL